MAIDCRSDLVARPTEAMIEAMVASFRAPGAFGLREDPQHQRLERFAAQLLGMEDALLFPTCTMANEAAIIAQSHPGDVLLTEESSHILTSEGGGPAALAGVLVRTFAGISGQIELSALERSLQPPADELRPAVALIVLENTHNRSGGACLPLDYHRAVADLARPKRVPIHLDGARLFNAAVAFGCRPDEITNHVTTVAVSLNKALCAPLGAVLAGPAAVIRRASHIRQRLGGGIRPTGFLAAAGLVALESMIPRLAEDHSNAARAASLLRTIHGIVVSTPEPVTNMVLVTLNERLGALERFLGLLEQRGVRALAFGPRTLRLVFHRDIDGAAVERLAEAVAESAAEAAGRAS